MLPQRTGFACGHILKKIEKLSRPINRMEGDDGVYLSSEVRGANPIAHAANLQLCHRIIIDALKVCDRPFKYGKQSRPDGHRTYFGFNGFTHCRIGFRIRVKTFASVLIFLCTNSEANQTVYLSIGTKLDSIGIGPTPFP